MERERIKVALIRYDECLESLHPTFDKIGNRRTVSEGMNGGRRREG